MFAKIQKTSKSITMITKFQITTPTKKTIRSQKRIVKDQLLAYFIAQKGNHRQSSNEQKSLTKNNSIQPHKKHRRKSCSCIECGNQSRFQKKIDIVHPLTNIEYYLSQLKPMETSPVRIRKLPSRVQESKILISPANSPRKRYTTIIQQPNSQAKISCQPRTDMQLPQANKQEMESPGDNKSEISGVSEANSGRMIRIREKNTSLSIKLTQGRSFQKLDSINSFASSIEDRIIEKDIKVPLTCRSSPIRQNKQSFVIVKDSNKLNSSRIIESYLKKIPSVPSIPHEILKSQVSPKKIRFKQNFPTIYGSLNQQLLFLKQKQKIMK